MIANTRSMWKLRAGRYQSTLSRERQPKLRALRVYGLYVAGFPVNQIGATADEHQRNGVSGGTVRNLVKVGRSMVYGRCGDAVTRANEVRRRELRKVRRVFEAQEKIPYVEQLANGLIVYNTMSSAEFARRYPNWKKDHGIP